jgi:hypothetical protein
MTCGSIAASRPRHRSGSSRAATAACSCAAGRWARATDRGLNRLERSFPAAAARSARRRTRRLRALAAALACLLILAVGSAAVAIRQSQRANEERATAERAARAADSRRLAAEAVGGLRSSIDLPSLLALEAYLRAPTVEARSALVKVLQAAPRLRATPRFHASAQVPLVDVTSGGTVVSAGWDRTVRFWDAALARPRGDPIALAAEPQGLATSSDGRWLAVATDAGSGSGKSTRADGRLHVRSALQATYSGSRWAVPARY